MFELVIINNPRTPEGGWEDEMGCDLCGAVSCAYIALRVNLLNEEILTIKMCGGCLNAAEKEQNKTILSQCLKRVG